MSDHSVLDQLSISHGQVLTVIDAMRIVSWLSRPSLDSVLKKFSQKKIPDFSKSGQSGRAGADFAYRYRDLMDCVVAMKLTADGLPFRHVVSLMSIDAELLDSIYKRAYLEAEAGSGALLKVKGEREGQDITIASLYLDFRAKIEVHGVLTSRGPELLDPWQALVRYMSDDDKIHPISLLRLSQLAIRAVECARQARVVKRGRKS